MKADDWYKIADSPSGIDFSHKGIAEIRVADIDICVVQKGLELFACRSTCPHAGARFAEDGFINAASQIVCCVHNYRFSLKTGRDALNEGYFLKLYPIEVRTNGVFVKIS